MECKEEYVRKITAKYNKRHATAFVRKTSEKRFLGPWGLALKRHPSPDFGEQPTRLDRNEEFQLFAANHFMKYHLKNCSKRQVERYLKIYIALRNRSVSANWPLVLSCSNKYSERYSVYDLARLLENGYIALISAADGFDPWRGWRFSTYACNAIFRSFYRQPKAFEVTPQQLDETVDVAAPSRDENVALWIERLKKTLACSSLTEREIEVIAYRFGCDPNQPRLTLEEVGNIWHLTKERVRQIQHKALDKLRAELKSDPVLH